MRNTPARRDSSGKPLWRKRKNALIPIEDVMADLSRVTGFIGHAPSYEEMRKYGKVSATTCQRYFGTWENVKRQVGWVPAWESFEPYAIAPNDGHWLAGLIDGEGCFTMRHPVKKHTAWDPIFTISVRDDDSFMIDELIRVLGIENVHIHIDYRKAERRKGQNANPAVKLTIYDVHTLFYHLIATLKIYPLRSKKKNEIKVFELAVLVLLRKREEGRLNLRYKPDETESLKRCYYSLKELKQYNADYESILARFDLTPA